MKPGGNTPRAPIMAGYSSGGGGPGGGGGGESSSSLSSGLIIFTRTLCFFFGGSEDGGEGGGDGLRVLVGGISLTVAEPGLIPSTNETILRALPMILRPSCVTGVDLSLQVGTHVEGRISTESAANK